MKRLMVFVDHSNIFLSASTKKIRIDWRKLAIYLSESWLEKYDFTRCIMYGSVDKSRSEEECERQYNIFNIFDNYTKFDVKVLPFNSIIQKSEKMVDVQIAVDMIVLASRNAFDTAILCSGDADFIPAVRAVMDLGKEVYVAGFDSNSSRELRRESLGYIELDNIEEIIYHANPEKSIPSTSSTPIQKEDVKSRISRMAEEIGMQYNGNNEDSISKIRQVLSWLEKDAESHNDLEREGLHLTVVLEAFRSVIPNFNQKNLGFLKFSEFLQFACQDTPLQLVRLAPVGVHPPEIRIALRSRTPQGSDILQDIDNREIRRADAFDASNSSKTIAVKTENIIQTQPEALKSLQKQADIPYIDRMAEKISTLTSGGIDDWISKIREVLYWLDNDFEAYKDMGRNGIHLSVIQGALNHAIVDFNPICLGFQDLGELLQFACQGTPLHVVRAIPEEGQDSQSFVALKHKIPPGYEELPDLEKREIHNVETYSAILAEQSAPKIKLPSESVLVGTANWISENKFIDTFLERWISLAINSLNTSFDCESVRTSILSFDAAGVFHHEPEGVPVAEQKLSIIDGQCMPEDIMDALGKASQEKIGAMLHRVNQDLKPDVLKQLIPMVFARS